MLFDFQAFIAELREKEDKKEIIEKYEALYWPIEGRLQDQLRFADYLVNFPSVDFLTPDELGDDFDRDVLQKLVIGSFSSDYEMKKPEGEEKLELYIAVKSGDQSVVKTISELRSFQVLRLYEIYIEEQINLQILKKEDESESGAIDQEREMRLKKWKAVLDTLDRAHLVEEAKKDQGSQLEDLMGKL